MQEDFPQAEAFVDSDQMAKELAEDSQRHHGAMMATATAITSRRSRMP